MPEVGASSPGWQRRGRNGWTEAYDPEFHDPEGKHTAPELKLPPENQESSFPAAIFMQEKRAIPESFSHSTCSRCVTGIAKSFPYAAGFSWNDAAILPGFLEFVRVTDEI